MVIDHNDSYPPNIPSPLRPNEATTGNEHGAHLHEREGMKRLPPVGDSRPGCMGAATSFMTFDLHHLYRTRVNYCG